jgi:hypothetical protein
VPVQEKVRLWVSRWRWTSGHPGTHRDNETRSHGCTSRFTNVKSLIEPIAQRQRLPELSAQFEFSTEWEQCPQLSAQLAAEL